jgi:hypothetical protein
VEEQLVVNRYDKWLNVPTNVERANQRSGQGFRTSTNVRGLADLASRFSLSLWVGMGYALGNEQDEQHREGKN